jgi:hypothetical protein
MLCGIFDVSSDVFSAHSFFASGRIEIAYALLSTILLSYVLQAAFAFVVHRNQGKRGLVLEMCYVLLGLKPFVDTYRLMTGVRVPGSTMDSSMERSFCEGIEIVVEAIPAAIIQLVDLLGGSDPSLATLLSITASCITIAILTATMFWDKDRDAQLKLEFPSFYGAVEETRSWRSVTAVSLFLFSLTHVLSALSCISFLITTRAEALAAYLTARMVLYLTWKAVRRNWVYWIPGMGALLALVPRVLGKLLVDFTGNPQLRHPNEVGGAYWLFTCVETQLATVGSALAYSYFNTTTVRVPDNTLLNFFGVLLGVWAIALALASFVLCTRRSHWRTFVSIETAAQFSLSVFRGHIGDDERRVIVFRDNAALWHSFRPEVANWVASNYPSWTGPDAPPWFTDATRATIPTNMLPLAGIAAVASRSERTIVIAARSERTSVTTAASH